MLYFPPLSDLLYFSSNRHFRGTAAIGHFGKYHIIFVCPPPKFCIKSSLSWDLQRSQGKTKTMLMQNLGEQTKSIMVFSASGLSIIWNFCKFHNLRAIVYISGFPIFINCLKNEGKGTTLRQPDVDNHKAGGKLWKTSLACTSD